MNRHIIETLILSFALVASSAVFAKNEGQTYRIKSDLEIISVNNNHSLYYLRKQVEAAEMDFYDAFNALSDVEEFKVRCSKKSETGTRLRSTVCHPQYFLNKMAQETQDAWALALIDASPGQLPEGAVFPGIKAIEFSTRKKRKEALIHVEELVNKHPALLKTLIALEEKQQAYQAKKAQ